MVGRLAVGYLGRATVGFGAGDDGAGAPAPGYAFTVPAPVIGVRYWVNSLLGIDAGLGIGITGGSWETDDDDGDFGSGTGFILHGGVPLSLASTDHFSFQIIPEANIGIGSGDAGPDGDGHLNYSGFHFDIGARAGAEIHFGFMKIPQLSLQGSVGLLFAMDSAKTEVEGGGSVSNSRTAFETTVGSNPWNIFTSNVAALYYF